LPANVLTPASYRQGVARLARQYGWRMRFLGRAALERLGAGAFLAVTQAHDAEGGIVHLRYRPKRARPAPVLALVGKGVCFDTGGINLKPHRSMLDMHTDMGGSAVALAVLEALTALKFPFGVDAWLALAENQIGPTAYKPQDVVRAANGTTIQVIHSDAEGRMLLADTLVLAARERPKMILDFATLTGACVTALSERYAGVFTNRAELRATLEGAGVASGERVWAFPMDEDFDSDLESRVADVLQCAVDARADHILAARFLKRFVPDEIAWAHVDLAPSERKGGLGHITTDVTGFGVRFALNLLLDSGVLAGLR
jgi:leucyl aminopeptidase